MRVVRAAHFLGSVLGLFAAKLGEELDVSVLWVELGLYNFVHQTEMDEQCERLVRFLVGYCLCFCSLLYRVTVHVCQARILALA